VGENLVLLHGFGATSRSWDGVAAHLPRERYRPLALDLPGHGAAADCERPITFAGSVEGVLARAPRRFTLGGYSLGGRVALHVALEAPQRVRRLVLISSTAGIEDAVERARRRASDRQLAGELQSAPLERFIARWNAQPLFAEDPAEVQVLAGEDQRRNRADALAAALLGLGTGEMDPLWNRLAELRMPVTVVAGARDAKFQALGRRMAGALAVGELVVLSGGHRLHLESAQALAGVLMSRQEPSGREPR
jgi:2-succinyl-6-hydroxy-2,4-cyclohexadiene-1-carboxylate synthase